jgi:hypothetical protein
MRKSLLVLFLCLLPVSVPKTLAAEEVYLSPTKFISDSFAEQTSSKKKLAIDPVLSKKVSKIMGAHYKLSETTYWTHGGRTAWILEDIGKYEPITVGIVISPQGEIERLKVLIYRESHGWEVKHEFFTRQFKGANLKREKKLDQRIDGISGATLSVNALKRLGALALMLHKNVHSAP